IKGYYYLIVLLLVAIIVIIFLSPIDNSDYNNIIIKVMEWNMNLLIGAILALIILVISSQMIEKHEIKHFIMNCVLFSIFLIYIIVIIFLSPIDNSNYNNIINKVMEWNMNLLIGALLALIISVISSQKIEKHEIKNFIMNWVLFSIFLIYMLILLSFFSIEN